MPKYEIRTSFHYQHVWDVVESLTDGPEVRVSYMLKLGQPRVDMRIYRRGPSTTSPASPTRSGFDFPVEDVYKVLSALQKAVQRLEQEGLIKPPSEPEGP